MCRTACSMRRVCSSSAVSNCVADGNPAAAGQGTHIKRDDEAAWKQLLGTERLSGGDLRETIANELIDIFRRDIADRRRVAEHLAIGKAGADHVRRHVEQLEIAAVEKHDAVVRIADANALRCAVERDPGEREQLFHRARLAIACPSVAARRHSTCGNELLGAFLL